MRHEISTRKNRFPKVYIQRDRDVSSSRQILMPLWMYTRYIYLIFYVSAPCNDYTILVHLLMYVPDAYRAKSYLVLKLRDSFPRVQTHSSDANVLSSLTVILATIALTLLSCSSATISTLTNAAEQHECLEGRLVQRN